MRDTQRLVAVLSLSLVLSSVLRSGNCADSNQLANGDFELWSDRGRLADGWAYSQWLKKLDAAKGEKLEMVVNARQAYRGSHCIRVVAVDPHRIHSHKPPAVEPGEDYVLSVHARGRGQLALGVYEIDASNRFLVTTQDRKPSALTSKWQRYSYRFTPKNGKAARTRFFVWVKGEMYLDTASFHPATDGEDATTPIGFNPVLTTPFMATAPKLDGQLTPGEWAEAAATTGFLSLSGRLASQQSKVYAGFDERNLYFAFVSYSPSSMRAEVKERDGMVFGDDAFEVYLMPPPQNLPAEAKGAYYHFSGNAIGTRYEAKERDRSWNGPWQLTCHREYDEFLVATTWTAEMTIPFECFGLATAPPDGTQWRLNFCRDWSKTLGGTKADRQERWTTWAPVGGDFHNPEKFATLRFSRRAPAVQLTDLGDLPRGYVAPNGVLHARAASTVSLDWAVVPADARDRRVASSSQAIPLTPGEQKEFRLQGELEIAGTEPWPVILVVTARAHDGQIVLRNVTPYRAIPGFRVDVAPLYLKGSLVAEFDIQRLPNVPTSATGRVEVLADGDEVLARAAVPNLGQRKRATATANISDILPGEYTLRASLVGPAGKVLAAKSQALPVPNRPEWFGNRLGISDRPPPPFTDLGASGRQISIWGRTYELGDLLLPAQISIKGTKFLPAPIRLVYATDAGGQAWSRTEWRLRSASATQADYAFGASTETALLSGSLRAEYDGLLLFDIDLKPRDQGTQITDLRIEIPLHRRMAHFLRASNTAITKWGAKPAYTSACIGDVKPKRVPEGYAPGYSPQGWTWGEEFVSQFWVGDDYRGLFCYQDSAKDRNWSGPPVDVAHQGDVTVIRVHFINLPTPLDRVRHYRFGLQATPLKKRERKMEQMVYGGVSVVRRMKKNGVPPGTIPAVVIWKVGRLEKDYLVLDPKRLRAHARYARNHGVELLLNNGEGFFVEPHPDLKLYGSDWIQQPPVRYPNHEGTDVTLVKVCPASSFADYYLWWLKNLIEECDIGGLYLDLSGPAGCSNRHHGHGYEQDGERHTESDMFATRELYKRFYTFLKEEGAKRGREFYVFQHSGPGIISPFVDMVTKGEGWVAADTWETLTPVYFRACENLVPVGVPYTFYPSVSIPWRRTPVGKHLAPHHEVLARTLIHDVFPVGIWSTQVQKELIPLWRAWQSFGVNDAEWVPYFENDPRVRTTSDALLPSFYVRSGRVLVVVSNLTRESVSGSLVLGREALGLPAGALKVEELRSGKLRSLEDATLPITIGATDLAILLIN